MTQAMGKKQRGWQGLPDDILQSIAQRLYISDYLVFRQVCPNWRAAVDRGIATRSCSPSPQPPWLLLLNSYGLGSGDRDSLDAFCFQHQYSFLRSPTSFRSEIISARKRFCVGSVESWLIVTVRKQCRSFNFMFNPLSRARVDLPSCTSSLTKAVASWPPSESTKCFAAALCSLNRLGICRPTDAFWTFLMTIQGLQYKDLEIIDEKLYVVGVIDGKYIVLEIDMFSEDNNVTRAKYNCSMYIYIPYFAALDESDLCAFLVRDFASKELFVVLCTGTIRKGVLVYKMKRVSSDGKPYLEKVTDLNDRILFLSWRSNKVIHDETLGKNCIYFAFKLTEGFWVYSLMDMSLRRVHLPKDYSSQICGSTLWFTPHPCGSSITTDTLRTS